MSDNTGLDEARERWERQRLSVRGARGAGKTETLAADLDAYFDAVSPEPNALTKLVDEGIERIDKATLPEWQSQAPAAVEARERENLVKASEQAAHEVVRTAVNMRRLKGGAPEPTGVRLKQRTGTVLEIFDDGSVRRQWKKAPGITGRQFRKALKAARREVKANERRATAQLSALLPVLPGHDHTFGENLQPTCGCAYSADALSQLRELARAGTLLASPTVSPENNQPE